MTDRYQHRECDRAIIENRPDDACEGCRSIRGTSQATGPRRHGRELTDAEIAAMAGEDEA